jgi:hypothetical protein
LSRPDRLAVDTPMSRTNPTLFETRQSQPLDRKSAWALLYLALPVALFFAGWFKPIFAALLLVALALGLFHALRGVLSGAAPEPAAVTWPWGLGLAAVALGWTCLGGAGHLFYANADWGIRDAVLRDLTVVSWPPSYGQPEGLDLILRAPVAYYLPAATLGKWLGVHWADKLLLAWTGLGMLLFFQLLPLSRQPLRWALGLASVVLFSGLDIVGGLLFYGTWPPAGSHIEWWASAFQYSSHTTQLFWVPNHALPAWLAMALFFRHWRHPDFLRFAPMLFALLPLWSPFAAIGMAPFYVLLLPGAARARWRFLHPLNLLPALLILAVTGLYLTLDLASVPAQSQIGAGGVPLDFMVLYSVFCTLEFGLLGLALFRHGKGPLLAMALLTLCVLPFFRMGPGNDIVMRGGIPALMLLCLIFLSSLQDLRLNLQDLAGTAVILLIGAITPMEEIYRALSQPSWPFHDNRSLMEAAQGTLPPHYVARLNQPQLQQAMRVPSTVSSP